MFRSHSCVLHLRQSCPCVCYESVRGGGDGTIAPHILKDIQKQYQRTTIRKLLFCYAHYKTLKTTQQDTHLQRNRKKKNPPKQKQNKNKKSDTTTLCLDYVTHASFIVLKRLNVKNFPLTIMMSHTAKPLIKYLQMSIELLGSFPHTVLPYIPPRLGGRKAVKWGSLVVNHTAITLSCFYP